MQISNNLNRPTGQRNNFNELSWIQAPNRFKDIVQLNQQLIQNII